jgi:iron complex outermembrane receptor protein
MVCWRFALLLSMLVPALAVPLPVAAQSGLEEVVVTARKREESLQEVPIAITAFTAEQLEKSGVTRLEEITLQTAGVQYHSLGLAIPGRVNSSIRFRGMDVNSQVPTFQLGTLFVDGIYVLGGTHSIPLDDIERVEVVKGPQSAYFGRNTFGGAINYISKQPSMSEYTGDIGLSYAQYDDVEVTAALSGPIVRDRLAFRIAARKYSTGGMWTASDGGKLGAQASDTLSFALKATPIDGMTLLARGFIGYDEDGPAAGGAIPGRLNNTCSGSYTNNAGEVVTPMLWFCGNVPEQGRAISVLGTTRIIDSNTQVTSARALASTGDVNWLLPNLIQREQPAAIAGKVPRLEEIELERRVERYSFKGSYEFAGGWAIDAVYGNNTLRANWVRDFNFTGFDNAYSRDPQLSRDKSYELRLTSPQDRRFRWLLGVNRYEQSFLASATGGDAAFLCVDTIPGPTIGSCRPGPASNAFALFPNTLANTDRVENDAVFAAVAIDLGAQFTVNLEGRQQEDTFRRGLTNPQTLGTRRFLPRVILQWQPDDDLNVYASFARGVIQGEINQLVVDADARERAQFDALGVVGQVPEEILDSYEIGWKQRFLDRRASLNAAFYYGLWDNKKSRQIYPINFTCDNSPAIPGVTPGCRGATTVPGEAVAGQPARNADGTPALQNSNVVAPLDVRIWGAEFEASAAVTDRLQVGGSLTFAKSEMQTGFFVTVASIAGSANITGNSNPRFPGWSGSINGTYTAPLNDDWNWYVRGDANYFGKTYVDLDNFAICKGYVLANGRAGVEKEGVRVELFVKNLFDDDSWAACARFLEFDLPQDGAGNPNIYQTVIVAPQLKRQIGLRASWKF